MAKLRTSGQTKTKLLQRIFFFAHAERVSSAEKLQIELRPENNSDEPLLFSLYASTREEELALTGWDSATREAFVRMQFSAQRAAYREMFPHACFNIVLVDGLALGRIVVDRAEDEIRLVDLVIAPEQRGRGIGSELMNQLIRESAASRKPLRLHVIIGSRAHAWYQRLGFVVLKDQTPYLEMELVPA